MTKLDSPVYVVVNSVAEDNELNRVKFEAAYGIRLNGNSVDDAYLKVQELADKVIDSDYSKNDFYLNCIPTITNGIRELDVTRLDKLFVEVIDRNPTAVNLNKEDVFYVALRAQNSQALRIYDVILVFARIYSKYHDDDAYGYIVLAFNYDDVKKHPVLKISTNAFINCIYRFWSKLFPKKMTDEMLDKELPNKMLSLIDYSIMKTDDGNVYLNYSFNSRFLVIPGKCEDENTNDSDRGES